jgi:hypothetical protein
VSPQVLALLGIAIGALLVGGSNFLLALRQETIEARAGAHIIREILEKASTEVNRLIGEKDSELPDGPRWGPVGSLPDSRAWDLYRSAVSARLPLVTLQQVDKAMRRLDALDAAATRALELADRLEAYIWDAAMKDDKIAVEKLTQQKRPEILTSPAAMALEPAANDFKVAYDALLKVAPIRPVKRRTIGALIVPWSRWHWRPLMVCLVVTMIAIPLVVVGVTPRSETTEIQDILATHLKSSALTACEPVKDHEDRFSCVAVEKADGPGCPVSIASTASHQLLASITATPAEVDPACETVTRALQYSADRQHDSDCIAFFESAVSEAPSASEQKKAGFLARLKAKLSKGIVPPVEEMPPVIVPDTAFMVGC